MTEFFIHDIEKLEKDYYQDLQDAYDNIQHSVIEIPKFMTDSGHEYITESLPDFDLFNYYVDDKFQYPTKRGTIQWNKDFPIGEKCVGKSPILENTSIPFDERELPDIWQQMFKEISSEEYLRFITRSNGKVEDFMIYSNFWWTFCEPLSESLENYNYVGKSLTASKSIGTKRDFGNNEEISSGLLMQRGCWNIREKKYNSQGVIAPMMKPHVGDGNKRLSIIYYLNTEHDWKEEYGGRTVFYDLKVKQNGWMEAHYDSNPYFDSNPIWMPNCTENKTVAFMNTPQCWHAIEDCQVPDKSYIRKNFIVVVQV